MKKFKKNWVYLLMLLIALILENSNAYENGETSIIIATLILWIVLIARLISLLIYLIQEEKIATKKKKAVAETTANS